MFRDIAVELPTHFLLPRGLRTPTLPYADDTLLLATRPTDITRLLHTVEQHSRNHNLLLNHEKCKLLVTNDDRVKITFADGTPVTKVDTLYLGAWLHSHLDMGQLRRKLGKARGVMRQLSPFWQTWKCTGPMEIENF